MKKNKLFVALLGIVIIVNILLGSFYNVRAENTVNSDELSISYRTHVENIGWQEYVKDGEMAGTTGQALRVEGINIKLNSDSINVKYQVHVQNIGWQSWRSNDEMAGTEGKSLRAEAIKIVLENTEEYDIKYRVHVQNIGWQDWKQNGEMAGTEGLGLRMEAIEIKVVAKTSVKYKVNVENSGWQENKKNGEVAGTEGQALRLESIKIQLDNSESISHIKYRTHIQNIGWQSWRQDNEISGTEGKDLRMEAIQINLEGMPGYTVEYKAHVQNIGWQDWVSNGMTAGTEGLGLRMEALQIRIVKDENLVVKPSYNNNSNINSNVSDNRFNVNTIDESRYPGYKEKIQQLMNAHPNWDFKMLYTGLSLDQAVRGEYAVHSRNLVPSNYSGEWVCSVCGTRLYDSGWYCASEKAIAYYMDSRNFLDDTNVFQFLDLNTYESNSVSLDGIQSKVNGSFLQNYAGEINNACINTNVNPYYIISRLLQEQGYSGTTIGKGMDGGDGRTYFNPFNIGASGNGYDAIYANALATAKSYGWDSMQKAIEGGISFCKKNWLENYQNTLYQNKFDIDSTNGTSLYTHQYMQNLMAAYSEARTLRGMYANTGKIDSSFTFIIPVYESAGSSASQPSYNSEATPINVKVMANGGLNLRSGASTGSSVIMTVPQGEVVLSIQRGINSNWQKVMLNDGTIGFMSGTYLQQIADVTNCNYSAYVKTSDGSGCYIRVGPSTRVDRITALSDGTWLTVISEGIYNNIDGYNWVRVLLSDGRQAFMPSKYLSR